jgi:hypothetical protein
LKLAVCALCRFFVVRQCDESSKTSVHKIFADKFRTPSSLLLPSFMSSYELSKTKIEQVLQDIEDATESYLDVDFRSICNDDFHLYGDPGGEKRRAFQIKVGYFKKWPVQKYVAYLDENDVSPSASMLCLLRKAPAQPTVAEDQDEFFEARDDHGNDNDGNDDDGMGDLERELD